MENIYYNSDLARRCCTNPIIKAVLLNYIYNFHKPNFRKGAGHPASISLAQFVDRYNPKGKPLWKKSFIGKILKDLKNEGLLNINREYNTPVYTVSDEVAGILTDENAPIVSFNLEVACELGLHIAIVSRFVLYAIDQSPEGVAYHLDVKKMVEVNRLSQAQIYRAIQHLEENVVERVRSPLKHRARGLNLARQETKSAPKVVSGAK